VGLEQSSAAQIAAAGPAMSEPFSKYINTPFERDIRPGIPPGAQLSPKSKINPEKCGKIPGLLLPEGWIGLPKALQNQPATPSGLKAWDRWGTNNVALRGGDFIGIDIDTDDQALADEIRATADRCLGPAPVRGRPSSSHCLLVYMRAEGAEPIVKHTISWRMPGDDPSSAPKHMLEILGESGHMMIEGVHPTGTWYQYRDGKDLIAWGAENLATVDNHRIGELLNEAISAIQSAGGTIVSRNVRGSTSSNRYKIGDPSLLAPSVQIAIEALRFIPCEDLDYNEWIKVTAAFKAATGGTAEAYEAYIDWCLDYEQNDEQVADDKWESIHDSSVGADWLFSKATEWGFNFAASYFEPVSDEDAPKGDEPGDQRDEGSLTDVSAAARRERWEDRFAYVEPLKEFVDLRSANLQRYDLQAFKLKFPQFDPWNIKSNAVIRYLRSGRSTICDGYTYLPGSPRIVEERGRRCLNRWSPGLQLLDRKVSDDEIRPWLNHVEYIVPDAEERTLLLDWLAHLVQRRLPKVNFAILLGGVEGIGKSLLFVPIVRVLGPVNVRTTSETEIKDKFTSWVAERELVMIEEIYGLSEEVMNRLKMYIAAPPDMVPVNEKNVKHYEVPNVARFVTFTNSRYALQLSDTDRRWFILWSPAEPKEERYYDELTMWFADNAVFVGSWLAQRDLSYFAAQERAPMTAAKREMRLAAMGSLDYWVHEAIANRASPFETDLVSVEDVVHRLPYDARDLRPTPNGKNVSMALKKAGALQLSRVSLGKELETTGANRTVLWAIRAQPMLRDLNHEKLAELFWKQRSERVRGEAFPVLSGYQGTTG
jgi:Family of unknown function (DUF5906)/Primase C terminal 2 (PriCT-2)